MNIFLPYEYSIKESVQSLDDRRLIKQILEVYQLLAIHLKELRGEQVKGYSRHPIYLHYKNYPDFMIEYGIQACREYQYRFNKEHSFYGKFIELFFNEDGQRFLYYKPFYAEGSSRSKECIRTCENVGNLYKNKLIDKWDRDSVKPKWTKRGSPDFYKRG